MYQSLRSQIILDDRCLLPEPVDFGVIACKNPIKCGQFLWKREKAKKISCTHWNQSYWPPCWDATDVFRLYAGMKYITAKLFVLNCASGYNYLDLHKWKIISFPIFLLSQHCGWQFNWRTRWDLVAILLIVCMCVWGCTRTKWSTSGTTIIFFSVFVWWHDIQVKTIILTVGSFCLKLKLLIRPYVR